MKIIPIQEKDFAKIFLQMLKSRQLCPACRDFHIYIDFLSAISAIFASLRRVSPWTRL